MIVNIENVNYNILIPNGKNLHNRIPIIFLHGFTGSLKDFSFFYKSLPKKFFPIGIDLIGHGETDSPKDISLYYIETIVNHLKKIIKKLSLKEIILYGYSMGGRVALSFALKHSDMIKGLILESSTAGINNIVQRKERIKNDKFLSHKIIEKGIENFIDDWMELPLFTSLQKIKKQKLKNLLQSKKENSIQGLSNMLLGFSTGMMPSYWNELKSIKFSVLLFSGKEDKKFTKINRKMKQLIETSQHIIIEKAGHNLHFEVPQKIIFHLNNFLETNITEI